MTAPPLALQLTGIRRTFGRTVALDGAALMVRRGTVHAVLGENGAGKTTLMRIAFGMLSPDAGEMLVDGTPCTFRSPRDAIAAGIGMVHQHFTLVPAMTVAENITLGNRGTYHVGRARARALAAAARVRFSLSPDTRVAELGVGAQQRVEIVKALARDTRLLILDEPTAVLTPAESSDLLYRMRDLAASGTTVVLITHKLRDALAFANDITVLRHGRTCLAAEATSLDERQLTAAMLGEEASAAVQDDAERAAGATRSSTGRGDAVITLTEVSVTDEQGVRRLRDATVSVRPGEILGVAGVEGSGCRELLRVMAGRLAPFSGSVSLPQDIGFVPEDRLRDALIREFSLTENIALRGAGTRRGTMDWSAISANTRRALDESDVRAAGPSVRAGTLSGGNQQKLVLARELAANTAALVAENPTRGLDIAATAAVHARLRGARARGAAIVVYSSDLDEVLALADRLVVTFAGGVREVPLDRETAGRMMVGST